MVFMLLAVVFFFILLGLFILAVKFAQIKKSAAVLEEERAVVMLQKIAEMPEFRCHNKELCVDTDSLMAMINVSSYKDFFFF